MGPVCNLFYSILVIYEDKESTGKQAVLEYLMRVEDWGEMELRLYAMFGFVLDVETTYVLMGTVLKRSKQYLDVPAASKLLYTILSNNFSTFLSNKNIKYAEETIKLSWHDFGILPESCLLFLKKPDRN